MVEDIGAAHLRTPSLTGLTPRFSIPPPPSLIPPMIASALVVLSLAPIISGPLACCQRHHRCHILAAATQFALRISGRDIQSKGEQQLQIKFSSRFPSHQLFQPQQVVQAQKLADSSGARVATRCHSKNSVTNHCSKSLLLRAQAT